LPDSRAWFAEKTGLGKMIREKVHKYRTKPGTGRPVGGDVDKL